MNYLQRRHAVIPCWWSFWDGPGVGVGGVYQTWKMILEYILDIIFHGKSKHCHVISNTSGTTDSLYFWQSIITTSLLPIASTAWIRNSQVGSVELFNQNTNIYFRQSCEWLGEWAWLAWIVLSWCSAKWSLVPKFLHSAASGRQQRNARSVDASGEEKYEIFHE